MEERISQYFGKDEIIFLCDEPPCGFEEGKKKAPRLTKGWHELCQLEEDIRFELIRDYWFNALPVIPTFRAFIDRFFAKVEKIGIISTSGGIFMTYTLKDRSECFFGGPPLIDDEIETLKGEVDVSLPEDFCRFYRIHNGFFKGGDTGIYSSGVLVEEAQRFKQLGRLLKLGSQKVPTDLILPFYRSFGLDVYQCFYKEWYPDGGMGNILCSLSEETLSDPNRDPMAFPTFLEWLTFYMEEVK